MQFVHRLLKRIREISIDIYPRFVCGRKYRRAMGRDVNWKHPRDINEKMIWLNCYSDTSEWVDLSDKVKAREFVRNKGYEGILIPLYGVWTDAEDIEFDKLPEKFILKCNHDSGSYVVVDKSAGFDRGEVVAYLNGCLSRKYGYRFGERHYNKILPRVLAEELLVQTDTAISKSLIDFKVWCFNGMPHTVHAYFDRVKDCYRTNVYDLEWNLRKDCSVYNEKVHDGEGLVPRPKNLERMLSIASDLSAGFPEVRVDFYDIDGKIYFGEMTFTTDAGHIKNYSQDYLNELGDLCELPRNRKYFI